MNVNKNEFEVESKERIYKILIVDDEQEVLESLRLTLKNAKDFRSEILTANDGQAALEKMVSEDFDLVLADYKMPGMNGVEFLSEVNDRHPKTARILITGYSDLDNAKDAIDNAIVEKYIEKPWHNQNLREIILESLINKNNKIGLA